MRKLAHLNNLKNNSQHNISLSKKPQHTIDPELEIRQLMQEFAEESDGFHQTLKSFSRLCSDDIGGGIY